MSIFAIRGGGILMPMILSYSELLIRISITIIKLLFRNDNLTVFVIKHLLYICLLFRLPLRLMRLLYGKYIVHLHRKCETVVICTKKMCIYVIRKNMYITLYIFLFIPFSVPFRFPFRVLVTPNDHECQKNRSNF